MCAQGGVPRARDAGHILCCVFNVCSSVDWPFQVSPCEAAMTGSLD